MYCVVATGVAVWSDQVEVEVDDLWTRARDELFGFGNESLGTRLGPQVHSHVELFTWYNHLQATERGAIIHINEHQILLFTDRLHPALQRKRTFVN